MMSIRGGAAGHESADLPANGICLRGMPPKHSHDAIAARISGDCMNRATQNAAATLQSHAARCAHHHDHTPALKKTTLTAALTQNPIVVSMQAALSYVMMPLIPIMFYGIYKAVEPAFQKMPAYPEAASNFPPSAGA